MKDNIETVLRYVRACGGEGATFAQIATALDLSSHRASERCERLKKLGLIIDSGSRRETRRGVKAAVLKVVKG